MAKRKPTAKKPSLLDIARELPKKQSGKLSFFDKMKPEDQAELLALRAEFRAGKLKPHIDGRYLYTHVFNVQHPGVTSDPTFRRWLIQEERSNGQS